MDTEPTELLTIPEQGPIKGRQCESIYGHKYFSFEGIPYAQKPLGELRFRAPKPATPWTEVIDCTKCASKPLQKNELTGNIEGTEDCLYINVYPKTLNSAKPLPVMVWIYGGGFYMGGATRELYSPEYFMSEDVVFVTFNYRLCSLGFLSLNDPDLRIPGNAGLKDQVLALRWVKQHIAAFNGDPNNITLFGESAGGASTHYMMLTEQTRGLFQRAIPMSGSAINLWADMPQTNMAYRLAQFHGYTGDNVDAQVLEFLQQLEPTQLVNHSLLNDEDRRKSYLFAFGPIVEPYVGVDCVVPERPFDMLKKTWSNDIPILIGGTSYEGLLMYKRLKMFPQMMQTILHDPERVLPEQVRKMHSADENRELGQKILKLFFGRKEPSDRSMFKFMDIYSYTLFLHDIHRVVLARLAYASAPTYLYRFDFDSPDFNFYRTIFCGKDTAVRGVSHADELSYLFHCWESWKLSPDSAEFKTIQRMVGICTAFAKDSNPNCDEIKPNNWQPLQRGDPYTALNISQEVRIMELPEKLKLDAYDELYTFEEQLY